MRTIVIALQNSVDFKDIGVATSSNTFFRSLVSMIGSFAGLGGGLGLFGISGFGPMIAIAGVALASFFLILDFDAIEKGIAASAPEQESWRAAFGLMVTIVWLYMEILRLLSILRGRD